MGMHKRLDSPKIKNEFSKGNTGKGECSVACSSQHVEGDSLKDMVIDLTRLLERIKEVQELLDQKRQCI